MDNFIGIITGLGIMLVVMFFLGLIYYLLQKFLGIKVIPRFTAHKEFENQQNVKDQLSGLNDELLRKAIAQTEKKNYSRTHENVLAEAIKIKNKDEKSNPYIYQDKDTLREAIKIVNNYYYDLQKDSDFLIDKSLEDVHMLIIKNSSLEYFMANHNLIQDQYLKNQISFDEYRVKRKIILSNTINKLKT
ncbi:MAG: hypothetical protein PSX36_12845 [bacterium]|nr:hypothetical protein [bacterium]